MKKKHLNRLQKLKMYLQRRRDYSDFPVHGEDNRKYCSRIAAGRL